LWPVRTTAEANSANLANIAAPITPAANAPIDLFDLMHRKSLPLLSFYRFGL
jgi:hypothetical protein